MTRWVRKFWSWMLELSPELFVRKEDDLERLHLIGLKVEELAHQLKTGSLSVWASSMIRTTGLPSSTPSLQRKFLKT